MKKTLIYIPIILGLIQDLNIQSASAQYVAQNAIYNTNIPGKIEFQDTPSWSGLFHTITPAGKKYFKPLEKNMATICSVVTDVPAMKPPKGFNVKPYISSAYNKQATNNKYTQYYDPVALMNVTFCNYAFYTLNQTRKMVQSTTWTSSIAISENDPEWLIHEDNNLDENCDSVGIPHFYYHPAMHKDKNGDWVIKSSHNLSEIRIIKKKGVPLYTPVTQKEYLEYKLKLYQKQLTGLKKDLIYNKKNSAEHPKDQVLKDDIHYTEDNITTTEKGIREYEKALSTWTADKFNEPAFISEYYYNPSHGSFIDLVPPDYKGAQELVRLNKNYFDRSLPAGTPQLIMIGADYNISATPNMKQEVKSWFNEINYEKLQSMIR
jgi:hypothetical protein